MILNFLTIPVMSFGKMVKVRVLNSLPYAADLSEKIDFFAESLILDQNTAAIIRSM